ncbi:Glu-tRNA(Gln) amidotransferase subunit GatE [bacterium]|nr:Glu-tRNA(Gln) amidotransferase subunit GatE [candidate division CSSED10-310 bacterium]
MVDLNYEALGFKAGLEIHQQLRTGKKLFCRCPARYCNGPHDAEVLRHMRPTLSELGEYDGTALMEFKTKKTVIYRIFQAVDCTYEMDDTPPFLVNQEALEIALEIALLLDLNIVDEMHISRKQYLDGSIPTGFQRTAIVGVNGSLPLDGRDIEIIQLGLEEDACREVSDVGHTITFKADRLGFPLVEVVTAPQLRNPNEVMAMAELIRRVLRSTGKVRTGLGAGREDVNVSIRGGTRVEIKGVSRIPAIGRLVHNEALRQKSLLEIRDILRGRGITGETLHPLHKNLTFLFTETDNPYLKQAVERGWMIRGARLRGFANLMDYQVQENVPFLREFEGRVRVIACLDQRPLIIHRGGAAARGISGGEWERVAERMEAAHTDEVLIVWGPEEDAKTAVKEICLRAEEATRGVPSETRQALPDGSTDFERILPGPDRMYPDTDSPPTELPRRRLDAIRQRLPEAVWVQERRYRELGLPSDVVQSLPVSGNAILFRRLVEELHVPPVLAGVVLEQHLRHLGRRGVPITSLNQERLLEVFAKYMEERFYKEAFPDVLREAVSRRQVPVTAILADLGIDPPGRDTLPGLVTELMEKVPAPRTGIPEARLRYYMGRVMGTMRGRAPGGAVRAAVAAALGVPD